MMHRVLITGVTGFVGSNLVHFFVHNSFFIVGHSRDIEKAKEQFKNTAIQLVEECSARIIDEYKIDTVIHLAGIAHDLSNTYKPDDYDRVNFENTKVVFNEFVKSTAVKFIFLSSIKAAIDTSSSPVTEAITPTPVTPYGKSKRKAEEYIQSIPLEQGKSAYVFRPCMIHGPGNKGNLNLLYRYAKSGLPFPFGSFVNNRSFLGIDNLNAIMQTFIEKNIPSGIFHLADSGSLSTVELFKLISTQIGKHPTSWNLPASGIRFLFSAIGKKQMLNKLTEDFVISNQKLLQYLEKPLPVELKEGLKKTIQSFNVAP